MCASTYINTKKLHRGVGVVCSYGIYLITLCLILNWFKRKNCWWKTSDGVLCLSTEMIFDSDVWQPCPNNNNMPRNGAFVIWHLGCLNQMFGFEWRVCRYDVILTVSDSVWAPRWGRTNQRPSIKILPSWPQM